MSLSWYSETASSASWPRTIVKGQKKLLPAPQILGPQTSRRRLIGSNRTSRQNSTQRKGRGRRNAKARKRSRKRSNDCIRESSRFESLHWQCHGLSDSTHSLCLLSLYRRSKGESKLVTNCSMTPQRHKQISNMPSKLFYPSLMLK